VRAFNSLTGDEQPKIQELNEETENLIIERKFKDKT